MTICCQPQKKTGYFRSFLLLFLLFPGTLRLREGDELIRREVHLAEHAARIRGAAGGAVALGKNELSSGKHKLYLSFHSYHREQPDGDIDIVCAYAVDKVAVEPFAETVGYAVCSHAAVSERTAALDQLGIETDRFCNLDNDERKLGSRVAFKTFGFRAEFVVHGIGFKYGYILLAAEEYYPLVAGGKSFDLHATAAGYAYLKLHAEEVADGYLEKSAVKRDLLEGYAGAYNVYAAAAYRCRVVNNLLGAVAEVHTKILKAVFISSGIEYSVYTDTNRIVRFAAG